MLHQYVPPQEMLSANGREFPASAPLADSHLATLQWLLQQKSKEQPQSSGIMINSTFPSSQDDNLEPEYSFTQESEDCQGSWPMAMTTPLYPLQLHLNVSAPQQPQLSHSPVFPQWTHNSNYVLPNEANSSSSTYMMMNYSPSDSNSLSPFGVQATSSLPQLSPGSSDPSRSPSYGASRLSTPVTPASTQSFMPSPTLSQGEHLLQQDSQGLTSDPNQPGFTHRQQLQLFRDALDLPSHGAGPFIPQPMYKPHTTSDRKRYVEDVLLEPPIYFFVEHSNSDQYGISLHDALHSRVKNLVNREQVVFEGRGPSVSIRLEWPGYRQWSRQIPTKDFRSPPGPITIAKLAKNVAKCVQRFMLDRKSLPMEEGYDDKWRIGDGLGCLKLEDLMLVSIHHVSLGSWQPHLRLRRPFPYNIPIQSSQAGSSTVNNSLGLGWA